MDTAFANSTLDAVLAEARKRYTDANPASLAGRRGRHARRQHAHRAVPHALSAGDGARAGLPAVGHGWS